MDVGLELLAVLFIVLLPTVPVSIAFASIVRRRRRSSAGTDVARGPAETPFVLLASVGTIVAVAALVGLLLTVAARALA